jgi:hypothetical protein
MKGPFVGVAHEAEGAHVNQSALKPTSALSSPNKIALALGGFGSFRHVFAVVDPKLASSFSAAPHSLQRFASAAARQIIYRRVLSSAARLLTRGCFSKLQ